MLRDLECSNLSALIFYCQSSRLPPIGQKYSSITSFLKFSNLIEKQIILLCRFVSRNTFPSMPRDVTA